MDNHHGKHGRHELGDRLRDAGRAHEPNRERMLARIERGMAEDGAGARRPGRPSRPSVAPWLRVIGATVAASGVLCVGGLAVGAAVRDEGPQQTVASSPTPTASATASATSRPAPPPPTPEDTPAAPSTTPSGTPKAPATAPSASAPAASGTVTGAPDDGDGEDGGDGGLWADGSIDPHSNDYWAQSNITIKNEQPLTALAVELSVAQTGEVVNAGTWRSLPETDFDLSVQEKDGALVYRWTLKEGRTVPAGEHVFAGQYDHASGGRDAEDDFYTITADGPGEPGDVRGDFE